MISVKQLFDLTKCLSPGVIGEHFDVDSRCVAITEVSGKLHFRMLWVIALNKASDKTNNDRLWDRRADSYRRLS